MNNNKGFTLVELLAVIAILAILVILAIPAIIQMYNKAKINSFVNEARILFRTAEEQYLVDTMNGKDATKYCSKDQGSLCVEVDMSSSSFDSYEILFTNGKITNFYFAAKGYSISAYDANEVKIDELGTTYEVEEFSGSQE